MLCLAKESESDVKNGRVRYRDGAANSPLLHVQSFASHSITKAMKNLLVLLLVMVVPCAYQVGLLLERTQENGRNPRSLALVNNNNSDNDNDDDMFRCIRTGLHKICALRADSQLMSGMQVLAALCIRVD
ncbi:hypothetical protein ANN_19510 [Periplaneta americana]|uniref:Uncharacterized protein n=1 Tax=Periplaneta americana TaxID=6978 RepID=A0ABQ8SA35_PERAM|nr:hypothetical protein ANN_19510 [Periplaneta americana]